MQKIALTISITLLTLGLIFAGVSYTSPSLIQGWANKIYSAPVEEDAIIFDELSSGSGNDSSEGGSARILGESTSEEPSSVPKQQVKYYPPPTAVPTPQPVIQQAQSQQVPWSNFADKEAYCKNFAQDTVASPKMLEIANEYYDKLVNSLPAPEPGQDPSTYLTTPTFSQYYAGLKGDVYKASYDECIKS